MGILLGCRGGVVLLSGIDVHQFGAAIFAEAAIQSAIFGNTLRVEAGRVAPALAGLLPEGNGAVVVLLTAGAEAGGCGGIG
jgi:hypothetical protein